jgi:hypothetical protein
MAEMVRMNWYLAALGSIDGCCIVGFAWFGSARLWASVGAGTWARGFRDIARVFGGCAGLACGDLWVCVSVLACWEVSWRCINHCLVVVLCLACNCGVICMGCVYIGVI